MPSSHHVAVNNTVSLERPPAPGTCTPVTAMSWASGSFADNQSASLLPASSVSIMFLRAMVSPSRQRAVETRFLARANTPLDRFIFFSSHLADC